MDPPAALVGGDRGAAAPLVGSVAAAAAQARPLRVLVASHNHPRISNGGAEIAAFRLFQALQAAAGVEAWFLGCDTRPGAGRDGIALTQPFTDAEYVYSTGGRFDWFKLANNDPLFPGEFESLLADLRPDVVHLHHYVNFGVECMLTIRRALPHAIIVVTLHEFLAICNHFGQMVKRGHLNLCDRASLDACHQCFPAIDRSDFFMRERYIKLFLDLADHFVSPSRFLAQRYEEWGIAGGRLSVIENIIAPAAPLPARATPGEGAAGVLRIGFFGQISMLKGIDVVLDCAALLAGETTARIAFEIYGDYKNQPPEFQEAFLARLASIGGNVKFRGAYRQEQVDQLMRGVDAVLVPSIWWENSPVVIQEALRTRRPVICSDIGGMAEKVREGVDGFHFSVASSLELSELLMRLYRERDTLIAMRADMAQPPAVAAILAEHLALYRGVASRRG